MSASRFRCRHQIRRLLPARRFLVAVVLAAGTLAGCHRARGTHGNWKLTLSTAPKVPVAGQPTRFLLHIARSNGEPLAGATAQLSLRMTFMDMGTTAVQLAAQGRGNYAGSGQFSMSGDWDCRAAVQYGGIQRQRTFHYKVD